MSADTPTPAPPEELGPEVTVFAIASADGTLSQPVDFAPDGVPVYQRPLGFGFVIIVEGRPGDDTLSVGLSSFDHDPNDPEQRPDLQLLADRPLGDGSAAVCGTSPGTLGGVAAVPSLSFDVTQPISDAINDIGCHFIDGRGRTRGRFANSGCVRYANGIYRFADDASRVEFCATMTKQAAFPPGDTRLKVRLRNLGGRTGAERELIVRTPS